jgi:hypothetical protein
MMIIIDDIEQKSQEWHRIRAGIPTASEFSKIVKENGDPSKSQEGYIHQLAGERILGMSENGYQSYDMLKGIEREAEARAYYEFVTGETVKQVGFVYKDMSKSCGCSPDGLIKSFMTRCSSVSPEKYPMESLPTFEPPREFYTKGLEIKCPKLKNHVAQLLSKELPPDKFHQIQGCMWVCDLHSWVFLSYYPGLPPFILEVQRDYKFIGALEYELERFNEELEAVYKELKDKT